MTTDPNDQGVQPEDPPEELRRSKHWRNLEESRDKHKERADRLYNQLLHRAVKEQGYNPAKGTGKFALKAFTQQYPDLEPEQLNETLVKFFEEEGLEPPSQGQGQQNQQQNEPSPAEQLMQQQQQQGAQLQDLSQPQNQPNKPLQQQIAEAEAAGDSQKAQNLSYQLATQQFIENVQRNQVVQPMHPPAAPQG